MQEIANSKEITFFCGRQSLEWSKFFYMISFQPPIDFGGSPELIISHPIYMAGLTKRLKSAMQPGEGWWRISEILDACESRQCQEPVDRIWAILGMLPNAFREYIEYSNIIDYSVEQKMKEAPLPAWKFSRRRIDLIEYSRKVLSYSEYPELWNECR